MGFQSQNHSKGYILAEPSSISKKPDHQDLFCYEKDMK